MSYVAEHNGIWQRKETPMEKDLKPVKRTPKLLAEQVAGQITDLIKTNKWEAGYKLPNEFEMASLLHVGRGTIREAVKLLVAQNVVEIRRGCGTFVCEKPGMAKDPLGLSFVADKKKLAQDMCEVRLLIEPQIADMAAERADEDHISRVRELCELTEKKILAGEKYAEEDAAFHEALASCTGNQVIMQLMPIIRKGVALFIDVTSIGRRTATIEEHRLIVEAVAEGDSAKAAEVMEEHIRKSQINVSDLPGKGHKEDREKGKKG